MAAGYARIRPPGNIGQVGPLLLGRPGEIPVLKQFSSSHQVFFAAQKGSTKKLGQYSNYVEQRNDIKRIKIFLFVSLREHWQYSAALR